MLKKEGKIKVIKKQNRNGIYLRCKYNPIGLSKSRLHLLQNQSEAQFGPRMECSEATLAERSDPPKIAEFEAEEEMVACVVVSMDKLAFVELGVPIEGGPDKIESLTNSWSDPEEATELVAKSLKYL